MSTENSSAFTKENLDLYLKELSREYKKLSVLEQLKGMKEQT